MITENFMKAALKEAEKSLISGDVPIGAVVVYQGKIIAKGYNKREKKLKISHHAEIIALEKAAQKLGTWKLNDCELYTTLEPCIMCFGAIVQSRIKKVYISSLGNNNKNYTYSKYIQTPAYFEYGLFENESQKLLKNFFQERRKK